MENNKITVTTPDNKVLQVEVLDIFNVVGYEGKEYILYTLGESVDDNNERAYVSILDQQGDVFSLTEINDTKEWEIVQKAIEEGLTMEEEE